MAPCPPLLAATMGDRPSRPAWLSVHRFHVTVAPGTKLESGPATLHLCNDVLVVARDVPPVVTGQWKLSDLRRYGAVPNGFIFEGGTRCGYCKYAAAGGPRPQVLPRPQTISAPGTPALLASRDKVWGLSLKMGAGCEYRPPVLPLGVGGSQQGEGERWDPGRKPCGRCLGSRSEASSHNRGPALGALGWRQSRLSSGFRKREGANVCGRRFVET